MRQLLNELRRVLGETSPYAEFDVANVGNNSGSLVPNSQIVSMPFHTDSARTVWAAAEKLARQHPDAASATILQQACDQCHIHVSEMTPEDGRLLEIGILWAQKESIGPYDPDRTPRIHSMPGGQTRSVGDGVYGNTGRPSY